MKITLRIKTLADMVRPGDKVIDVGCDHAYLSACLILNGVCETADASDIKEGPLKKAAETLKRHALEDRIMLYLTSGLEGIPKDAYNCVIIAGMGGETIAQIMDGCDWIRGNGVRLILNPMTSDEKLRQYLYENGFGILDERLAQEDEKIYICIKAQYDGIKRDFRPLELIFTDKMDKSTPQFKKYIQKRLKSYKTRQKGLEMSDRAKSQEALESAEIVSMLTRELNGGQDGQSF